MNRIKPLVLPLLLGLQSLSIVYAENPDCDGTNYCEKKCPEHDECKCEAGTTTTGSITFGMRIAGFIDGDTYRESTLNFVHQEPSVTMFTPQGLSYFSPAALSITSVEGDFSASEEVRIVVTHRGGRGVSYILQDGSSTAYPEDNGYGGLYELIMLDASGNPTVDSEPAFIKHLSLDDDSFVMFDFSSKKALSQTDAQGRIYDFSGVDVVRQSGVLRQIRNQTGLVDIVSIDPDFEFELRFYRDDQVDPGGPDSNGLYTLLPNAAPWQVVTIRNPAYDDQDIDETYITRVWDGRTTEWRFQYFPASETWEARIGEGTGASFELLRVEESSRVVSQDGASATKIKKVKTPSGTLLSETVKTLSNLGSGQPTFTTSITKDPTGANLVTTHTYYESGSKSGERKATIQPEGKWVAYDYDSQDRQTLQVESWNDVAYNGSASISSLAASAKATEYAYTPVDSLDDGTERPDSPRTETVKIEGVVTEKTWYAYYRDANGLYYEIEERATTQTAAYGDADNLRSEKIYYATIADGESGLRAGRLKSDLREDGSLTTYDYTEDVDGNFLVTETSAHAEAPGGVAGKTTRRVKTYDDLANLIREETYVYDGSAFQSVFYVTHDYDIDRNRTKTRRFDGIPAPEGRITYEAVYEHGKAVTVIDATGRRVDMAYDILDRKQFEIIEGSAAAGVGDITKSFGYSTAATGCGCTAAETTITDASGTLTMTEIDETDRVKRRTRTVDVNGLETTYEYADGGRTTTVTLPGGGTRITENYLDGRVKSVTGTGVIAQYFTYGVNSDGSTWTRVDTADGSQLGDDDISDAPDLRWTKSTADVAGHRITEESPAFDGTVLTASFSYDSYGRISSRTQPGQADSLYEYDSAGDMVLSGLDVDGDGQLVLASTDRISASSRSWLLEDGSWFDVSTTTVYPIDDDPTAVTISTNKSRLSGFSGDVVSESIRVDIDGKKTTSTTEIDPATKTVTRSTDVPGSTIIAVSTTINGYLKSQNSTTVAAATTYGYDGLGRQVSMKDPRHAASSTISYLPSSTQVATQTDADGNTTSFAYVPNGSPGAGQVSEITDALGQKGYYAYDLLGRQTRTWGETDYPQEYGYNSYGELATLTTWRDATGSIDFTTAMWPSPTGGDVTTWIYQTSTGLLTRKEYADTNGTDYSYDSANRLSVRTWARNGGLDTTYSYDPATGELTSVDYEGADTTDIVYTYDRLGRQTTVTDATGTRSFAYDSSDLRLTAESLPGAFYGPVTLNRFYEDGTETNGLPGRPAGFVLSDDGWTVAQATYGYDPYGRLLTVSDATDTFTYAYETDSNLLASVTGPEHAVSYDYKDNRDLMKKVDNRIPDLSGTSVSVSKFTYRYDGIGRRTDRVDEGTAFAQDALFDWDYDSKSQVIAADRYLGTDPDNPGTPVAAEAAAFDYDQIGNRLTSNFGTSSQRTYTANALNQYTTLTNPPLTTSPTHDADGNLTHDGEEWWFEWNGENRLKKARNYSDPLNPASGSVRLTFRYDHQGRRVAKTVEEYNDQLASMQVVSDERFSYDGWNLIAEFDIQPSSFTLHTSYLWGQDLSGSMQGAGGVGGLLSVTKNQEPGTPNFYPTYDANGNVSEYLDETGAVAAHYEYSPFGRIIASTGTSDDFAFRFSTKYQDNETDLLYYGFRYYVPETGRWLSRDPIGERGGLNLYAFVGNDGVNWVDSFGLTPRNPIGPPSRDPIPSNTPPRPDGYPGWPSTFRHHGNWGGPGWANGGWNLEDGHLPSPGDADYVEPEGERDACYEKHDRCINVCPDCPEDDRSDCIEDCDHDLADCLYDLNNPLLWPEAFLFDTLIPWLVH